MITLLQCLKGLQAMDLNDAFAAEGCWSIKKRSTGICGGVMAYFHVATNESYGFYSSGVNAQLTNLMTQWPRYSGVHAFPVPSTLPGFGPNGCFWEAKDLDELWTGEYGQLRIELLQWMINYLEERDV
ncbi:hypothetical protein SmaMPs15_000076 [Stenotrophomonas maltophilia phage vB_SmaM_Ps15]|uniref:Uncharacterized protein n=1 Tax=Stenotrophomonas maltophilia phage vB_SmaM_Ps15 TaxID=3071007 RepID=A0AAE9FL72_9CAUD|nr:hypothetical protein PQC01_gp076 [Stenotrophomonas maltophilia phage vB_SmaM_Ps15]UMO77227.1 hypothetical protein SmaMPs15_000076 [Stenotrophomonas maltophilia phage vB_SmaM_Ps15]